MSNRRLDLLQVRILPKSSLPAATSSRVGRLARQAENFALLYGADPDETGAIAPSSEYPDESVDTAGRFAAEDGAPPHEARQEAATQRKTREQSDASDSFSSPDSSAFHSGEAAALSSRIGRACAVGEETSLRTEYLASVVARFCNSPSIVEGGTWELRVELNPSVLAETKLFLQLSSYRLLLRFETENQRSRSLIYDNTNELGARLHALLQGKVDVEVTVW